MNQEMRTRLVETRFTNPRAIAEAASARRRRDLASTAQRLMIIAADHTARGVIGIGRNPTAMGDRYDLLDRLMAALAVPGVDGVLGTPDIIEDLLLLGALHDKAVFGSMNRGGMPGAAFELDDRFTAYTPEAIVTSGLDGGKMLLRIGLEDPGTAATLSACADAVTRLARAERLAMIEPFMNTRVDGHPKNVLTTEAVIRSVAIAGALGETSAYSWLKVPVVDDMARVAEATTMPIVLLGGERSDHPDEMYARWEAALHLPGVRGLVVGRNLLYPHDDDVAGAVKTAVSLL